MSVPLHLVEVGRDTTPIKMFFLQGAACGATPEELLVFLMMREPRPALLINGAAIPIPEEIEDVIDELLELADRRMPGWRNE